MAGPDTYDTPYVGLLPGPINPKLASTSNTIVPGLALPESSIVKVPPGNILTKSKKF